MRWIVTGVILALLMLGLNFTLRPSTAECVFCPAITCMDSMICGPGCFCLIPPGGITGSCWSIQ
jgi:hypothetical protein